MNEGPDFQPLADDDARDPLLGALRQRLGENFGQEPPPALWASIRQQLPAAAPRSWWLRSRRLLVLLALVGGVLLSGVAVWQAGLTNPAGHLAHRPATASVAPSPGRHGPRPAAAANRATTHQPLAGSPVAAPSLASRPAMAAPAATEGPRASAHLQAPPAAGPTSSTPALRAVKQPLTVAVATHHAKLAMRPATLAALRQRPRRHRSASELAATASRQPAAAPAGSTGPRRLIGSHRIGAALATAGQATATPVPLTAAVAHPRRASLTPARAVTALGSPQLTKAEATESAKVTAVATRAQRHQRAAGEPTIPRGASSSAATQLASLDPISAAALAPPAAPDLLAARRARLLLQALALPAPLVARPDSAGPWLPPARRWSMLALVGPALSYRTTGQLFTVQQSYAAAPAPTTTASNFAGRTLSADLAALERPAAGLGAQVQVRRVLTGRWALALGAGYQEYATQLVGQVTVARAAYNTAVSDSTFTVNHRETYRFFTLPVQLSYALGSPRGRLSLGLLGGLEPSWYQGGSVTVLSGTTARSLSFSAAAGSPFNSFNLAASLGLDARYRLGRPASRWQLVVQPTARYVATSFVHGNASNYASRQPYSLGLLTGFSWQLR